MHINLIHSLGDTELANVKFQAYYEAIQNLDSLVLELKSLLENDIRYSFGVFADFFNWYGIGIDVNDKGFSLYLLDESWKAKHDYPEFFYTLRDGDWYIARNYTTEDSLTIPSPYNQSHLSTQYCMREAILSGMHFLNK